MSTDAEAYLFLWTMLQFNSQHRRPDHLSTMLDFEHASASSQPLCQKTFSNHHVHTRLLAPSLADSDLAPIDFMTSGTIATRDADTRAVSANSIPCLSESRQWHDHVARVRHQDIQGNIGIRAISIPTISQCQAVLSSPVTSLPPEILTYIFELCLVGEGDLTHVFTLRQGPFRLAQVCKLWRAVATSDPHLWTSINFHFCDTHPNRAEDVSRVKPTFDLLLKRSGALPISLSFTDHRFYHAATEDLIALLVDRLRTHSRRWKRISLHLSCGYFPLLFMFIPCDFASLEHLCICGDVLGQRIVTAFRLDLESAKNLKSFAYSGPGHSPGDKIILCWERLVDVAFEFAPHNGMSSTLSRQFRHLAQCQNMTTCSLGIDQPFWRDFDQSITLPSLRTLRVRRLSPKAHAYTVIDALILPRLETLEIDAAVLVGWDGWNPPWHDHNFSDLLARSECNLCQLSIQDVDFPNEELVRCLALSPALTSFRFIPCPRSHDIADVIRQLDVSHPVGGHGQKHVGDGPLVPGLREITLASSVEGYLDLMLAMFRSRVGAHAHAADVAALRRVETRFFDMLHGLDAIRAGVSGGRLESVVAFQRAMARLVCESEDGKDMCGVEAERLEVSVVVCSNYVVEYINPV